jgi:hypothetical protein
VVKLGDRETVDVDFDAAGPPGLHQRELADRRASLGLN